MDLLKKFAKEISVFGIIIVVFFVLFAYRSMTFKDYTTISEKKLTQMVEKKEDFIVVLGDSSNSDMIAYQDVLATFTTKNRDTKIYFVDSKNNKEFDSYVEKTFNTNVTYPATLIIEDGQVKDKLEKAVQYYYLKDFIVSNAK